MRPVIRLAALCIAFALATGEAASQAVPGTVTGGTIYSIPAWFKSSFLDFEEDVAEARAEGRHVMAFMHLDECPYCARMLDENFREGPTRDFIEARFDVIALNVLGDLDVAWIDGSSYSERALADHLGVVGTPTIVFLDPDGAKVLQLSGYRDPASFRHALEYVDSRSYEKARFADYLADRPRPETYAFRDHPRFETFTYFKDLDKPLAIVFEDRYCTKCDDFHDKTLNRADVLEALEGFHVVRLDAESHGQVVEPGGAVTTAREWARSLDLTFRPAIVLFNGEREMYRANGLLYHQHLAEALLYASEGYRNYPAIDEFRRAYREQLVTSGRDVDFSE